MPGPDLYDVRRRTNLIGRESMCEQARSTPGVGLLQMCAAVGLAHMRGNDPSAIAGEACIGKHITRALQASVGSAGGFLVPQPFYDELIALLRPRCVMRGITPDRNKLKLPRGNLTIPRQRAGAFVGYIGEGYSNAYAQPAFEARVLVAHKAIGIVPISRDLEFFTRGQINQAIIDDLVRQFAVLEDTAFLRGSGAAGVPKGIRSEAKSVLQATQIWSTDTVISDIASVVGAMQNYYVPMNQPTWIFSAPVKNFLYDLRDQIGGFLFRGEMDQGKFRGHPFVWTQNIPVNLGISGNETELYLLDADQFLIADVGELRIDISSEAAYFDGVALQSAFARDEKAIRVIVEHDCALRHPEGCVVLTNVPWN